MVKYQFENHMHIVDCGVCPISYCFGDDGFESLACGITRKECPDSENDLPIIPEWCPLQEVE